MVSTSKGSHGCPQEKKFPSKAKMSMEVVSEASCSFPQFLPSMTINQCQTQSMLDWK
jgi:hypothetical protein